MLCAHVYVGCLIHELQKGFLRIIYKDESEKANQIFKINSFRNFLKMAKDYVIFFKLRNFDIF